MNLKKPTQFIQQGKQETMPSPYNKQIESINNKKLDNSPNSNNANNNLQLNPFIQNKQSKEEENHDDNKDEEENNEENEGEKEEEDNEEESEEEEKDIIAQKRRLLGQNLPDGNINNHNVKNVPDLNIPSIIQQDINQGNHPNIQIQPQQLQQQLPPQQNQAMPTFYPTSQPQVNPNYYPNILPMTFNPQQQNQSQSIQMQLPMMNYHFNNPFMIPQQQFIQIPQQQQQIPIQQPSQISLKQEEELMQLKVKMSNIETENAVLHEKIKELTKIALSSNASASVNKSNPKDAKLIKELMSKIEELEHENHNVKASINDKIDLNDRKHERLTIELKEKSEDYKKLFNEKERLISYVDTMKKDISALKKENERLENDNNRLYEQVSITEAKLEEMTQKQKINNDLMKSIKADYECLNQKYYAIKRENEKYQNDIANSREQNYFVKDQGNNQPQRQLTQGNRNKTNNSYQDSFDQQDHRYPLPKKQMKINNTYSNQQSRQYNNPHYSNEDDTQEEEEETYQPPKHLRTSINSNKPKDNLMNYNNYNTNPNNNINRDNRGKKRVNTNQNINREIEEKKATINKYKQDISRLVSHREKVENELFKIPEKNKTVRDIQEMKALEKELNEIETELNQSKRKLRELTKDDN